jgi:hypothetical protein
LNGHTQKRLAIRRSIVLVIALCILTGTIGLSQQASTERMVQSQPPGVIIDYIPSHTRDYVGSPGIAILPNGHYVASRQKLAAIDGIGWPVVVNAFYPPRPTLHHRHQQKAW